MKKGALILTNFFLPANIYFQVRLPVPMAVSTAATQVSDLFSSRLPESMMASVVRL